MQLKPEQIEAKQKIYERVATSAAALGSPARVLIIQLLSQAPRTVEQLAHMTGFSLANTSQHLQKLAAAQMVSVRKQGTHRHYALAQPEISAFLEELMHLTDLLDPLQRERENKLTEQKEFGVDVAPQAILEQVKNGVAVLIDVRTANEHSHTPVEGAIPMELELLKQEASGRFPKDQTIFVLCRGPYCTLATQAVKALRKKGYQAFRLRHSPLTLSKTKSKGKSR